MAQDEKGIAVLPEDEDQAEQMKASIAYYNHEAGGLK